MNTATLLIPKRLSQSSIHDNGYEQGWLDDRVKIFKINPKTGEEYLAEIREPNETVKSDIGFNNCPKKKKASYQNDGEKGDKRMVIRNNDGMYTGTVKPARAELVAFAEKNNYDGLISKAMRHFHIGHGTAKKWLIEENLLEKPKVTAIKKALQIDTEDKKTVNAIKEITSLQDELDRCHAEAIIQRGAKEQYEQQAKEFYEQNGVVCKRCGKVMGWNDIKGELSFDDGPYCESCYDILLAKTDIIIDFSEEVADGIMTKTQQIILNAQLLVNRVKEDRVALEIIRQLIKEGEL